MTTTTARERRLHAARAYEQYLNGCCTRQLLDLLADKWTTLVVIALADGAQRHSELAKRIAGVSQKMLTQTLRSLERDSLVTRAVTPTVPVRVDYELTALGRDLLPLLANITAWAEAHMFEVLYARRSLSVVSSRMWLNPGEELPASDRASCGSTPVESMAPGQGPHAR